MTMDRREFRWQGWAVIAAGLLVIGFTYALRRSNRRSDLHEALVETEEAARASLEDVSLPGDVSPDAVFSASGSDDEPSSQEQGGEVLPSNTI